MTNYACTLSGVVERQYYGPTTSLADAQAASRPYSGIIPLDIILYNILPMDLETALVLAPSDLVKVLFKATGVRGAPTTVHLLTQAILDHNYILLWSMGQRDWLATGLDTLDMLMLDLFGASKWLHIKDDPIVDHPPNWEWLRNRFDRGIKRLFSGDDRDSIYRLEGIRTETKLTKCLQKVVARLLDTYTYLKRLQDLTKEERVVRRYWTWILSKYGPMPFQHLIGLPQ